MEFQDYWAIFFTLLLFYLFARWAAPSSPIFWSVAILSVVGGLLAYTTNNGHVFKRMMRKLDEGGRGVERGAMKLLRQEERDRENLQFFLGGNYIIKHTPRIL